MRTALVELAGVVSGGAAGKECCYLGMGMLSAEILSWPRSLKRLDSYSREMNRMGGGCHMFDVVVVGSRCAGAPTAMLAARAGWRVLLLDRARFPSDTISTHLVHQPGVALLAKWGLLENVVATGCPPISRASYHVADVHLHGVSEPVDGHAVAYAPRRYLLDKILSDAAVEAGVEFLDGTVAVGVIRDSHGGVTGVRYRTGDGTVREAAARLVVGADGMRSTVARMVEASTTVEDPTLTCVYYAYWTDVSTGFALYEAPGRFVGTIPTNNGQTVVAAYFAQSHFDEIRRDSRRVYLDTVRSFLPGLGELGSLERRIGKLYGSGSQRNFFRCASGRGWVLVGDAGHHKDSITARGISDAFTQVELLANHVLPSVGDPEALRGSLDRFETLRDDALVESYHNALSVARLDVQKDRLRMLRTIAQDQRLVDQYFSVVSGAASVEDVYSQDVLLDSIVNS